MEETKQIIKRKTLSELKKDFYNNSLDLFKKYNCKSSRTFVETLREMKLLHKIQRPLNKKQKRALSKIPNALDILK